MKLGISTLSHSSPRAPKAFDVRAYASAIFLIGDHVSEVEATERAIKMTFGLLGIPYVPTAPDTVRDLVAQL